MIRVQTEPAGAGSVYGVLYMFHRHPKNCYTIWSIGLPFHSNLATLSNALLTLRLCDRRLFKCYWSNHFGKAAPKATKTTIHWSRFSNWRCSANCTYACTLPVPPSGKQAMAAAAHGAT